MSHLLERRFVQCPFSRAEGYLAESLSAAGERGSPETIRLHVSFREINLEKDVLVTYAPGEDPMHLEHPWKIQWTPAGGGPYPDLAGTLTVRAAEDYSSCTLELEGDYEPPLGAPGQVFDALVGRRIATNTAQLFLEEIALRMEARYRQEEAQKA